MSQSGTPSGFEAMGERVPEARLAYALQEVREMHPAITTEDAMGLVGKVAGSVEADRPYEAMQEAQEVLDLTGSYRLLAALCAAPIEGE